MIGTPVKKMGKDWFDEECNNAIKIRDEAYKVFLNRPTRGKKQGLDRSSKIVHNVCRGKKRQHLKKKIDEINKNFEKRNLHEVYKEIKSIKEGYKARTHLCKNLDVNLIGDKEQIINRRREFLKPFES